MDFTLSEFTTRFPEFINVDNNRFELFREDSYSLVNAKCPYSKLMAMYLTAHFIVLADRTANGNITPLKSVSSESVEGVSRSYDMGNAKHSNPYYQTAYGQKYVELKKACVGRPLIA